MSYEQSLDAVRRLSEHAINRDPNAPATVAERVKPTAQLPPTLNLSDETQLAAWRDTVKAMVQSNVLKYPDPYSAKAPKRLDNKRRMLGY